MANILMIAVATPGHVYPMLSIARYLIAQGHQVRVMTGALFRQRAEAAGAQFIAFDERVDFDYRYLEQHFPERAALPPGNAQMALALKDFFAAPIPLLDQQLRSVMAAETPDLLMVENCFYGVLPLLQRTDRPPVIGIGVTPLSYSSRDSIFYGPRIPPALLPRELRREQLVDEDIRALIDEVQQSFDIAMAQSGGQPLQQPFTDALIGGCDRFLQLATPALEYQREDLPDSVRFIGPLRSVAPAVEATDEWDDADRLPLVIVSQGTLANVDLHQLIVPTLKALAELPVRVLATTGGRPIDELLALLPANAKVREFISFEHWLPQAALLITNGGYGSINYALDQGVPLIVAGTGEDKLEAAARVVAAGCGISLHTSTPDEKQLRQAVQQILAQPAYRQRAAVVQADYARHDALTAIADEVAALTR
ncbi:PGL/p-HBAD biosynthesis rhamnosyltransferase [Serratia quinivorans]|nr:PGL/p-HBAD biosynthesis rhamnosyltransferase [Serratia quinivorans]CAI1050742.1 PGL/p-HBAD biosynthesis rhamnosyltransferase [Serratia quinivorans]CAI1767576.1 PGL/p-HBAD biosynthesis rhamnosyltransferase [Serratia quinivorans]CAI2122920.1 PGL/p-HBAD biosynthesis rhamnosyltransferase [Serratia quinivorans]CAI2130552.1 PGL/p-HBAD biosynthesis rhamnosyltransferase [Serratia quinivorans]